MTRMPSVTASELIRFLKKHGYAEDRQSGSHLTLWNDMTKKAITIPIHSGCDLGCGLTIRILKDAGFSIEEFMAAR